ncbi:MAG: hypothetical protein IJJ56_01210, partial [Prevotella sp.]|nr:hypothetical protein [Prevotella sp.]
ELMDEEMLQLIVSVAEQITSPGLDKKNYFFEREDNTIGVFSISNGRANTNYTTNYSTHLRPVTTLTFK